MQQYGIVEQLVDGTSIQSQELSLLGYTVVESRLTKLEIENVRSEYERLKSLYAAGLANFDLESLGESAMIRSPLLTLRSEVFLKVALDQNLHQVISNAIRGKYVLTQQNGVTNPPRQPYSQGRWHRDLPYQHFTSSRPIAVNALYCVDDFKISNGATMVLPGSHRVESAPSAEYFEKHKTSVEAKAGSFLVLDSMIFHSGQHNSSSSERRGLNHVFAIPYFKQQISLSSLDGEAFINELTSDQRFVLGLQPEPRSLEEYFGNLVRKLST
jgi:ectoine hydroxylase-related dioxygenase (phytanoyl-CoA dioxygenase family)